jgi:ferredoxin
VTARVTVDPGRCVGSGDCALNAPEAFEVDEDAALAHVLPGAEAADPAVLQRAAHSCPTGAIGLSTDR